MHKQVNVVITALELLECWVPGTAQYVWLADTADKVFIHAKPYVASKLYLMFYMHYFQVSAASN